MLPDIQHVQISLGYSIWRFILTYTYYLYACSTHLKTRLKHLNISQPSFLMVSYGQGSSLEAALAPQTAWHWLQLRHSWSRFWQQRLHYLPLQRHPSGSASRIMEKVEEIIILDHPTSSNHFRKPRNVRKYLGNLDGSWWVKTSLL